MMTKLTSKPCVVVTPINPSEPYLRQVGAIESNIKHLLLSGTKQHGPIPRENFALRNFSMKQNNRALPIIVPKAFFALYERTKCLRIKDDPTLGNMIFQLSVFEYEMVNKDYLFCGLFFNAGRLKISFSDTPHQLFVMLSDDSPYEGTVVDVDQLAKYFGYNAIVQRAFSQIATPNMLEDSNMQNCLQNFAMCVGEQQSKMTQYSWLKLFEHIRLYSQSSSIQPVVPWPNGRSHCYMLTTASAIRHCSESGTQDLYTIDIVNRKGEVLTTSAIIQKPFSPTNYSGKIALHFYIDAKAKKCKLNISSYRDDQLSNLSEMAKGYL